MREKREKRDKRDKKKFKRFKARTCRFERMGVELVDWKDVATLQRLCTGQSKILARKRSGTSAPNSSRGERLSSSPTWLNMSKA